MNHFLFARLLPESPAGHRESDVGLADQPPFGRDLRDTLCQHREAARPRPHPFSLPDVSQLSHLLGDEASPPADRSAQAARPAGGPGDGGGRHDGSF